MTFRQRVLQLGVGRLLGKVDCLAWHSLGLWLSILEPVYGPEQARGRAGVEPPVLF